MDPENVLTSQIGYYYANEKKFYFRKNVVLVNPNTPCVRIRLCIIPKRKFRISMALTTIVSKENFIYCENGWYDTKNDVAQFNKNAYFKNKEQKLSGDSLYYDRKTGYGKALYNITAIDTVQKITVKGDYGEYWEKSGRHW